MIFFANLQNFFIQDYQSIAVVGKKVIIAFGANWAPGVWAGTEGAELHYKDYTFTIVKVDFDAHILECEKRKHAQESH